MRASNVMLIPTWLGAAAGLVLFILYGAVTGLVFGGYAGLAMAGMITGTPVEPTLLVKVITFGGMALGVLSTFFFFMVLGAFSGAVAGLPFTPALRRWATRSAPKGIAEGDVGVPGRQVAAKQP